MKITKRQLRQIIKEEKAKLLNEQLSDGSRYQSLINDVTENINNEFYIDMIKLFEEEPEAFAGRSSAQGWEQQVVYAQQELDTGIRAAIEDAIAEVETRLHDGQYDDGRG